MYTGDEVSSEGLNTLVDVLIEINNSDGENKVGAKIITTTGSQIDIPAEDLLDRTNIGTAISGKTYEVVASKDLTQGYINLVTIEDLGSTIDVFNRKYAKYDGEEVSGSILNGLLENILVNNTSTENLIDVKVTSSSGIVTEYSGENAKNIVTLGLAKTDSDYTVEITISSQTGYISKLEAKEVVQSDGVDLSQNSFNQKFSAYEGDDVLGSKVNELVDLVIYNNINDNEDRKIKITIYALSGDVISVSKKDAISKEIIGVAPDNKKFEIVAVIDKYSNNVEEIEIHEI